MNKIDFVVTWVDGSDKEWLKEKSKWVPNEQIGDKTFDEWVNSEIRFRDWDILKYWFRGVEKFAPWVNKVYFVTYGHLPSWLNTNNDKLCIVNHKDFIPKECLPTFNTNAIELNLHRIPNLSENFVYFNDDMFLMKPVKETDFFKNNLPVLTAAIDIVSFDLFLTLPAVNNMRVINEHFNKREVIKKNIGKWFNIKNGKHMIKTLLLMPWKKFSGLYEAHVAIPYKKRFFEEVWSLEGNLLEKTIKNKFRGEGDLSNWLIEDWQILSGNFEPRSWKFGKTFGKHIDKEILDAIRYQKYKCICINDFSCTQEEFEEQKLLLKKAFDEILPEKSSFEK